jgi:sulfur relay (sulfurtransferase) DsrF/TusC family protein
MKTTIVLISQSPLKTLRVAEALRMSVGLTLCDDAVQVVFVDDGVYALVGADPARVGMPEYARHVETLGQLGHRLVAERESLEERGIDRLAFTVDTVARAEVPALLVAGDCVIRY